MFLAFQGLAKNSILLGLLVSDGQRGDSQIILYLVGTYLLLCERKFVYDARATCFAHGQIRWIETP